MRMNAVLSNPKHPEYGQFTVPLPIPHNQYDGIMEALNAMDMGDPLARDCQMDEILGEYPILKRLEGKPVNIDELDYLAKRLDSFCYAQEGAQFQGAAVSYDYSDMTDLINLTFSCQQVTVITDFSDLEQVGREHYMVLNGGCASKEELDALDGYETALLLIDEGNGVITPYGVVYDNGMLAFFSVKPTNLSVQPPEAVGGRIYALMTVLKGQTEIEMLALNSKESFEDNKRYYRERAAMEELPVISRLLEADARSLDRLQVQMATAREFFVLIRFRDDQDADFRTQLSRVQKSLEDQGFKVRLAGKEDAKRMLGVYFEQNATTEKYEDFDGERWIVLND